MKYSHKKKDTTVRNVVISALCSFAISITLGAYLFQSTLGYVTGKDIPWYWDMLGGIICNAFIVPTWFICYLLANVAGVNTPFLH